MKIVIASDIHGSAKWCKKLIEFYEECGAQRLVLLGDLLYHGPRNDLPDGYAPKEVIAMLSELSESIRCVRGNCDAEVDQMVLPFSIMADYDVIKLGASTVYITHGHVYSDENPPAMAQGDILICGHTHVPVCRDNGEFIYINDGSVSIPKEGSPHSCVLWEDGRFDWIDIEKREVYMRFGG